MKEVEPDRHALTKKVLTEAQWRRALALEWAITLLPNASVNFKVNVARWIATGVWPSNREES